MTNSETKSYFLGTPLHERINLSCKYPGIMQTIIHPLSLCREQSCGENCWWLLKRFTTHECSLRNIGCWSKFLSFDFSSWNCKPLVILAQRLYNLIITSHLQASYFCAKLYTIVTIDTNHHYIVKEQKSKTIFQYDLKSWDCLFPWLWLYAQLLDQPPTHFYLAT